MYTKWEINEIYIFMITLNYHYLVGTILYYKTPKASAYNGQLIKKIKEISSYKINVQRYTSNLY